MISFRPLGEQVLIEFIPEDSKSPGGILIPESAQKRPTKGTVRAVGPGTDTYEMEVEVGNTVLFGKWSGTEVQLDRKTFIIMKESDIMGILN